MIERADYILVMDRDHLQEVIDLGSPVQREAAPTYNTPTFSNSRDVSSRVYLLSDFLPDNFREIHDIPDPYFGDWNTFTTVYKLIDTALTGFLNHLQSQSDILRKP